MGTLERMAIAAHLHVLLRRHLGRVSDVEWMSRNREYAESLAALAKASGQDELDEWAERLVRSFDAER